MSDKPSFAEAFPAASQSLAEGSEAFAKCLEALGDRLLDIIYLIEKITAVAVAHAPPDVAKDLVRELAILKVAPGFGVHQPSEDRRRGELIDAIKIEIDQTI